MKTRTVERDVFQALLGAALLLPAGMAFAGQAVKATPRVEASAQQAAGVSAKASDSMPNRISMNVTVGRQTQGATFGEKVNAGRIDVVLTSEGCVVLFPPHAGYKVNVFDQSIRELSGNEASSFGEKVNQGLHAAGGALAQGASLLGGALPGGAIISAAVSSVGHLAGGAGGGAAAASYAATGRQASTEATGTQVWKMEGRASDSNLELPDGDFELAFVIAHPATSGLKDTLKTQVRVGFTVENGVLKTKHDTAKNSVGNIR